MSRSLAIVAIIILAVAGVGYKIFNDSRTVETPEGIAFGNGRIEAVQIDISANIAGRVKDIQVKEGDLVKPGQTLAVIDTAQLLKGQAEIARVESEIAVAQASVEQIKARSTRA